MKEFNPVENCENELFSSLLFVAHLAQEQGLNVRFLTFSECGMEVQEGFHVYDWGENRAYGLSIRIESDGGVLVCDDHAFEFFLSFIRGFRTTSGMSPVVYTCNGDFLALVTCD